MAETRRIADLLVHRHRDDLASMVRASSLDFDMSDQYGRYHNSFVTSARLFSPIAYCERLRELDDGDTKLILDAVLEFHPPEEGGMDIRWVEYMFGSTDDDLPQLSDRELASELRAQLTVLVAVARFNRKYDKCAAEYRTRAGHLARELLKRGLPDPNPYATPQDWWRWYKDQHIDTVQEREVLLNRMFASTLTVLEAGPHALPRPSTWPDIETRVTAARSRLAGAVSEVQFQEVGLNCRELLLALAKIVYDPTRHTSSDGVAPSNADSKRQLDAYMLSTLRGNANEVTRKFAKAAIDLANQLTHRATSTLHDAALCLEASVAVVSIVAIISGRLG